MEETIDVGSYRLPADRFYDAATHLWVEVDAKGLLVRCGFDPLGSETSGDVVALSFEPVGSQIERGEAFGAIEAAKFVGPLRAPVSGLIRTHNAEVLANPSLVNRAPLSSWLVEMEPARLGEESSQMITGPRAVGDWFAAEVERFRSQGMVAE